MQLHYTQTDNVMVRFNQKHQYNAEKEKNHEDYQVKNRHIRYRGTKKIITETHLAKTMQDRRQHKLIKK